MKTKTLIEPRKTRKLYVKPTMERIAVFSNDFGIGLSAKTGQCLYFSKPEVYRPKNVI